MSNVHYIPALKDRHMAISAIHAVNVTELAAVADALIGDGRADLAAQVISVLYCCAGRQVDHENVIPLRGIKCGHAI